MNDKIKHRHYRFTDLFNSQAVDPRGGATLAYRHATVDGKEVMVGALALCNPSDNYNKAYGRAKSAGRLKQFEGLGYNVTLSDDLKHLFFEGDDERAFLSLADNEVISSVGAEPR